MVKTNMRKLRDMNETRSSVQKPTFPFYYLWTRNSWELILEEVTRFSADELHDPFIMALPGDLNGVWRGGGGWGDPKKKFITLSVVNRNLRLV